MTVGFCGRDCVSVSAASSGTVFWFGPFSFYPRRAWELNTRRFFWPFIVWISYGFPDLKRWDPSAACNKKEAQGERKVALVRFFYLFAWSEPLSELLQNDTSNGLLTDGAAQNHFEAIPFMSWRWDFFVYFKLCALTASSSRFSPTYSVRQVHKLLWNHFLNFPLR